MYNFFITPDKLSDGTAKINGADFNHIKNVLRLKTGDRLLISVNGTSSLCQIKEFGDDEVTVSVIDENYQDTSLPVKIHLFQGLPKSDKMELIIQKAVELGADSVTPVETERCVVKLDAKKKDGKTARWQAIAESAAKQSKRTTIPEVYPAVSFKEMIKKAQTVDLFIVPYENEKGMASTKETLSLIKSGMSVGVLVGPEGGFSEREISALKDTGAKIVSLGKRILRTETAAIATLSTLMLYAEMELND